MASFYPFRAVLRFFLSFHCLFFKLNVVWYARLIISALSDTIPTVSLNQWPLQVLLLVTLVVGAFKLLATLAQNQTTLCRLQHKQQIHSFPSGYTSIWNLKKNPNQATSPFTERMGTLSSFPPMPGHIPADLILAGTTPKAEWLRPTFYQSVVMFPVTSYKARPPALQNQPKNPTHSFQSPLLPCTT